MKAVIVITSRGKRSTQKFPLEEDAKKFFSLAQKRFPEHQVFLVELTKPLYELNTDYNPRRPDILHCPYCNELRRFFKNSQDDLSCPVCHISERDFHTRRCNGLFEEIEGSLKGGKKGKLERKLERIKRRKKE